jgi:hypothetical protein
MSACPAPEHLQRLLRGDLSPDLAGLMRQHVGGCAAC